MGESVFSLSEVFVASAPPSLRPHLRHVSNLEGILEELVRAGRQAWPDVKLEPAIYLRHVASRLGSSSELSASALRGLAAADLYLACACGERIATALEAFERKLLPSVLGALKRVDPSEEFLEEAKQAVRERLFVSEGDARPKILEYAGRGSLKGWLRATAIRTALNMRRGPQPDTVTEEALVDAPSGGRDPEMELIRARYGAVFRDCLREAVARLSPQERTMLRLHLSRGVEVRALAQHYRLHRSTITRRLAATRDALVEETRRLLFERLKLTPSEMKTMLKALTSQLDMDISQVLRPQGDG